MLGHGYYGCERLGFVQARATTTADAFVQWQQRVVQSGPHQHGRRLLPEYRILADSYCPAYAVFSASIVLICSANCQSKTAAFNSFACFLKKSCQTLGSSSVIMRG